ncbi:MAG: phosphoribosylaminoimidazolesuccinocarboxamide synthase [Oscillospiraceae bacterium]|nr:phosphoribosylaminoimidazolesuccinocarboxamide synthase [Oscillospiraceae bacterium]
MKLIYEGKTKNIYALDDGNYLLKLKDDATGENGVFDPGANTVGVTIEGLGKASLKMTMYYFELLNKKGVPTHFISADIENASMTVKPAALFGQGIGDGIEVICRFRAVGSFYRRYKTYCAEGMKLNAFVETTLKDDALGDPPVTKDALAELNIMTGGEYETLKSLTQKIAGIIKDDLTGKGLDLYDIKFEFGRVDGKIVLIDEISAGNVRIYKGNEWLQPLDLAKYF